MEEPANKDRYVKAKAYDAVCGTLEEEHLL